MGSTVASKQREKNGAYDGKLTYTLCYVRTPYTHDDGQQCDNTTLLCIVIPGI